VAEVVHHSTRQALTGFIIRRITYMGRTVEMFPVIGEVDSYNLWWAGANVCSDEDLTADGCLGEALPLLTAQLKAFEILGVEP
jgi:hypothetical protein